MKPISLITIAIAAAGAAIVASSASAQQLSGAGATFPAPLYQRWAVEYNKLHPKVQVNYQSVGSGAGVKQFMQGTVDFAASDAAMSDEEIAKAKQGVVMLPDVKDLKLSRDAYVGIFLGTVKKWNDPAIAKENSGVTLPDMPINVATRSDGSGTTFVFTKHLAAISKDFADEVGTDKSVTWPVGAGGKGNEGVTALIKQTPGTIGYVEYGYAVNNGLSMASLQNKAGNFVKPTDASGAATLAHVEFPENLRIWPEDPTGNEDYPIATFTWLLLYKKYSDADKLKALKEFVTYGLVEGQKFSAELGYIPLPAAVVEKSKAALSTVQ
jgi:phosphate transport system substrate-binding protein